MLKVSRPPLLSVESTGEKGEIARAPQRTRGRGRGVGHGERAAAQGQVVVEGGDEVPLECGGVAAAHVVAVDAARKAARRAPVVD